MKRRTKRVCSVAQGEILAGAAVAWKDARLQIPALPPTSGKECKVVQLKYSIAVREMLFFSSLQTERRYG